MVAVCVVFSEQESVSVCTVYPVSDLTLYLFFSQPSNCSPVASVDPTGPHLYNISACGFDGTIIRELKRNSDHLLSVYIEMPHMN